MRSSEPLTGAMSIFQNDFNEPAAVFTLPDNIKARICHIASLHAANTQRIEKRLDFALAKP